MRARTARLLPTITLLVPLFALSGGPNGHAATPAAPDRAEAAAQTVTRSGATRSAASPSAATSTAATSTAVQRCARQFDTAVGRYVDAHPARDLKMFASVVHDGWTVVFPDADILKGKREGLAWMRDFFADPGWNQSFTEERRVVSGCRTAFILFDSVYEEPAEGYRSHLKIGLTFTYEHGRWLVLHDQNTKVPEG